MITLTNSTITTGSAILITSNGGTNTTTDYVVEATPNTGFATITIYNNSVLALNGTMTLSFLVF